MEQELLLALLFIIPTFGVQMDPQTNGTKRIPQSLRPLKDESTYQNRKHSEKLRLRFGPSPECKTTQIFGYEIQSESLYKQEKNNHRVHVRIHL